jgi:hypothetical protein
LRATPTHSHNKLKVDNITEIFFIRDMKRCGELLISNYREESKSGRGAHEGI